MYANSGKAGREDVMMGRCYEASRTNDSEAIDEMKWYNVRLM